MTGQAAWYLVHTKPGQETTALANLERQGYRAFLPYLRRTVRRQGRYRERTEPLFPRYLFLRLDATDENWHPIHSTIGVSRLVRFGTWPAAVPEEIVEELRQQADASGIVTTDGPGELEPGQQVRVIDGPFAGCAGIVQNKNARERVDILLSLVGQYVSARVSGHQLAAS